MDKVKQEISISWATLFRIFFIVVLAVAFFMIREALLILFLSIVISAAFDGPVTALEKRKIPRIIGTLLVFVLVLGVTAMILYTVIPIGITEFKGFLDNVSRFRIPVFGSLQGDYFERLDLSLNTLADSLFSGSSSILDFIGVLFGNIILVITTIVITFYLTVSRAGVEKFLRTVLPLAHEEYAIGFYHRVRRKMGFWLQAQLVLMLTVGCVVFLGLWLLGVRYSLLLAVIAGSLEIVPIAGPMFSGIIGFLVASSSSFILGVYTAILFFIVHQLESNFLIPLIMRRTIGINPVVVVIALLAGSQIAGLIGIILAVPTAVIIEELFNDWEERKVRVRNTRLEI